MYPHFSPQCPPSLSRLFRAENLVVCRSCLGTETSSRCELWVVITLRLSDSGEEDLETSKLSNSAYTDGKVHGWLAGKSVIFGKILPRKLLRSNVFRRKYLGKVVIFSLCHLSDTFCQLLIRFFSFDNSTFLNYNIDTENVHP